MTVDLILQLDVLLGVLGTAHESKHAVLLILSDSTVQLDSKDGMTPRALHIFSSLMHLPLVQGPLQQILDLRISLKLRLRLILYHNCLTVIRCHFPDLKWFLRVLNEIAELVIINLKGRKLEIKVIGYESSLITGILLAYVLKGTW